MSASATGSWPTVLMLGLALALPPMAAAETNASPQPPCTTQTADCLQKIAALYLHALRIHDGSKLPLAPGVRRTENALTNARGPFEVRESFARTGMVEGTRDVRYITDPAKGEVVVFFRLDVDLKAADADATTKAGTTEYQVAVTVPEGTYTVHEAERFTVIKGMINEIEIIAHVEKGKGAGSGWPVARDPVASDKKKPEPAATPVPVPDAPPPATRPPATDAAAPASLVLLRRDLPLRTVYAWERWGNFINAVPGDGKDIPYDAAKLRARVYTFPSGEIRVIEFQKGTRTHTHVNMTDTIQFNWTGRRVQFAQDDAEQTRPGDAAFHPKGVFHHGEALEAGKTVEFAYAVDRQMPDPQTRWLNTTNTPLLDAAVMTERGGFRLATGPAAAAATSAHIAVRAYDFGRYVTRELRVNKGTTLPIQDDREHLLFVTSGRFDFDADGRIVGLGPEDAARAPAGKLVSFKALEDGVLVETQSAAP